MFDSHGLNWSLRTWTLVLIKSKLALLAFVLSLSLMSSKLFSYLERNSLHLSSISASCWTACMASDSQGAQCQWHLGQFVKDLYISLSRLVQLWQIHWVQRSHFMVWEVSVRVFFSTLLDNVLFDWDISDKLLKSVPMWRYYRTKLCQEFYTGNQ